MGQNESQEVESKKSESDRQTTNIHDPVAKKIESHCCLVDIFHGPKFRAPFPKQLEKFKNMRTIEKCRWDAAILVISGTKADLTRIGKLGFEEKEYGYRWADELRYTYNVYLRPMNFYFDEVTETITIYLVPSTNNGDDRDKTFAQRITDDFVNGKINFVSGSKVLDLRIIAYTTFEFLGSYKECEELDEFMKGEPIIYA